jgi:predicted aspartyl protease
MQTLTERRRKERKDVGRFSVEIELANNEDLVLARAGRIKPDQVRRVKLDGVVDPGATRLVLPKKAVEQLGLPLRDKVRVVYADKRRDLRHTVGNVWLKMQGRDGVFDALVEPKRDTALIGAIVLETLDFVVDCVAQKLVPRDPKYIICEVE